MNNNDLQLRFESVSIIQSAVQYDSYILYIFLSYFQLNLLARAFIVKEILCWQDDPDDIRIERAK